MHFRCIYDSGIIQTVSFPGHSDPCIVPIIESLLYMSVFLETLPYAQIWPIVFEPPFLSLLSSCYLIFSAILLPTKSLYNWSWTVLSLVHFDTQIWMEQQALRRTVSYRQSLAAMITNWRFTQVRFYTVAVKVTAVKKINALIWCVSIYTRC